MWWQQQLWVQSAATIVVVANSGPCLHPPFPALKLGPNLYLYPALQNASPMPTSQDGLPAVCLQPHQPAGPSCLGVGAYLTAQVSFWTGQQKVALPSELWSSKHWPYRCWQPALRTLFFHKGLLFSWHAHQLHVFSFFKLVRAVWIVSGMHLKVNFHSKFLLWSVASYLLQLGGMTVSAHEKHQHFLIYRQRSSSISDGNKSLKEPLKLCNSCFYSV